MDKTFQAAKQNIAHLSAIRDDIINHRENDSDKNMVRLNKVLDSLCSTLEEQLSNISSMRNVKREGFKEVQFNEQKQYFESFMEAMEAELLDIIDVAKDRIDTPKFDKKGLELVLNAKDSNLWTELQEKIKDEFYELITNFSKDLNVFPIIFKYFNLRDSLIVQLIKSLIYKKQMFLKDINAPPNEFLHGEEVNLIMQVHEQLDKAGFVSAQYTLDKTSLKPEGPFILKGSHKPATRINHVSEFVKLLFNTFDDTIMLVKNIFGMTNVEKEFAIENSRVVTSQLREALEQARLQILEMEQKLQQKNAKEMRTKSIQKLDEERTANLIMEKQTQIEKIEKDYKNEKKLNKNLEKQLKLLKDQMDEIEENNNKMANVYMPKLDEIQKQQAILIEEVKKMKKDVEYFPALFRAEKNEKIKLKIDKTSTEELVDKLANLLGKEKRKSKELQVELRRKEQISLEVIAAHEELKIKVEDLTRELEKYATVSI